MSRHSSPRFNAYRPSDGLMACLNGRQALTIWLLHRKGALGLRALDFPGGPAYRLAAYVHRLRKLGFNIRMALEDHVGGKHAVYWLDDTVEVRVPRNSG